jgi:hypothetical protein
MRGLLIVGILIVSLIVGYLVIVNLGGDPLGSGSENRAKAVIERAQDTAGQVDQTVRKLKKRLE